MKKCWFKRGKEIYLRKRDEPDADGLCQTTKEWFAAQVAEAMHLEHVKYDLRYLNNDMLSPICECKSFTDINTGFVPALIYFISNGVDPSFSQILTSSIYFHLNLAELYSKEQYEDMMVFDSIIGNKDRHILNYGILYDNSTGKILKPAPIYDNGLSFDLDEECCFFSREDELHYFLRPRHKKMLESILDMKLRQHSQVKIADEALTKIANYIKKFTEYALRYLSKHMQYTSILYLKLII